MTELSIFHPSGATGLGANPFGKDVANLQLIQALARHGGFEQIDILSARPAPAADLRAGLIGDQQAAVRISSTTLMDTAAPARSGTLLRGQPYLTELAWQRRRLRSDRAYSLVGLAHTLAPAAVRELMAEALTAPVFPWDAVICTSPAVRESLERMYADFGAWLAERTGGAPPAAPDLPVIPLGVDGASFAAMADRPGARESIRRELNLAEDDVLLLWVGRLSFFEKAFPQPMIHAARLAAERTGGRLVFALAGWFPNAGDETHFRQAAAAYAGPVEVRFENGNDRPRLEQLWAGADVFISLVDNIQETFGITPLEAMAAGLPVVASDWDGYRFTVRDGREGFLIPTLGGPPGGGMGETLIGRHALELDSYQTYVGAVAQHTAVHIGRCAAALEALIRSPDLRRQMGAAGRARIREAFDWPVVAMQYRELAERLGEVRRAAPDPQPQARSNPVKGDPFQAFRHFPTEVLTLERVLRAAEGASAAAVEASADVFLDAVFGGVRADAKTCARALELLQGQGPMAVRDILLAFPVEQRRGVEMGLAWLAKYGHVDWLADDAAS